MCLRMERKSVSRTQCNESCVETGVLGTREKGGEGKEV